jgi:hypothetical protein
MLVLPLPSSDQETPTQPKRHRRGGIVWQPHYEGFTTIAYQSGKAIAGISGPWSGQYVLIWWTHAQPIREVELFDSLDEAKQAVAQRLAPESRKKSAGTARRAPPAVHKGTAFSWLTGLQRWVLAVSGRAGKTRLVDHRRRHDGEETDLARLNIRASAESL